MVLDGGPCIAESFSCVQRPNLCGGPLWLKPKPGSKWQKVLGCGIQDAGSGWDVKFSIRENECSYCDDRLLKLPSPPSSLPGFPHLESIFLCHEISKTRLRRLLRCKSCTILAKLLVLWPFVVPSVLWRQKYLLCEYP